MRSRAWRKFVRREAAALSCPGRVQRARLRERNESRDPAQEARSAAEFLVTSRRVAPGCTQVGFTRLARIHVPISGGPEIGVSLRSPGTQDLRHHEPIN